MRWFLGICLTMMLISFCAALPAAGEVHGEEVTYESGGVELTGYLSYDDMTKLGAL